MSIYNQVDTIYNVLDAHMRASRFHVVDQILACVRVDSIPLTLALAYLTITIPARDLLRYRINYLAMVRERVRRERPEECDAIMRRLE